MNAVSKLLLSFVFSFSVGVLIGPFVIKFIKLFNLDRHPIRIDGPKRHIEEKKNRPSMGGIIIIISFLFSSVVFIKINFDIMIIFVTTILYASIGLFDDLKKILKKNSYAVGAKLKFIMQFAFAAPVAIFFSIKNGYTIYFPFGLSMYVGYLYILYVCIVIVATSNSVNLMDGLDGLVSFPLMVATSCFVWFFWVDGASNMSLLGMCFIGSVVGFLWFNIYPAKIFMGDVGSMACGAFLACFALSSKKEIMLIPIGMMFVIESLSVILQVFYYKKTKKRFFKMAPIHHHFEQNGLNEVTIVGRFWIAAIFFAVLAMIIWDYGY